MNLYFIRSNGEKRLIKENIVENDIANCITEYVKSLNPNFKIYYFRFWEEDNGTMYDIGSHSEFFFVGK